MAKEYTIPELLGLAGIRGYSPKLGSAINTLLTTENELEYQTALQTATSEASEIYNYSDIGTYSKSNHFDGLPIYMPLVFEQLETTSEDYLLESAIVSISRSKNIVITEVQGRDSTVKEFINNGDYDISISGLICKNGIGYPKNSVKEFSKFLTAKKSIKVVHEVLNMLGVYELVITDYDLPNSPFINVQRYSLNAISETPIELRIDE